MGSFQLFISYNHTDDGYRKDLEKWLVNLCENGLIDKWYDGDLLGGDHFWEKITQKVQEADIILLLLSQEYLASASCKKEMKYALSMSREKRVIPIVLKECTWLDTETQKLLALPQNGKPINTWNLSEQAWASVYEGIKKVTNEMKHNFELKDDFVKEIQKIEFVTASREKTKLEELFVFPSLAKYTNAFEKETVSLDYFTEVKDKFVLIRGRETSGKTSLARMLLLNLRELYSPILIDGNSIHKTLNFEDDIKKEFNRQMVGDFATWVMLEKKVAIIDNYHHKISSKLLGYLAANFIMTVILMDDEEYMLYFKDEASFSAFSTLSINQLSFAKQEQLIRKWLNLNSTKSNIDINDLDVDKLEVRVNTIITTNRIVPRYPFFVLSILQTFEAFMPSNLQITAYGHCYHALVIAQLAKKNIDSNDIDSCFNYLKNLSFDIYEKTKTGALYTKSQYVTFRENYKTRFIIKDSLINKIENDDYPILNLQFEDVTFEYEYIYYYFLGMHLAANENAAIVNELCENVHLRKNAFVLIFTIHHTQNKNLLDTIRLHCVYSFEKQRPAELSSEETRFMNNLIAELPETIVSDKGVHENRLKERNHKDITTEDREKKRTDIKEEQNITAIELQKGVKILDVLGQILKNRAGSFEKQEVLEILEETVDLGLRILSVFLDECKEQDFKDWLSLSLQKVEDDLEKEKHRGMDDEKRKAYIEKLIQFFGYLVTVGVINRISESISSDKLVTSMEILTDRKNTPAYEMIGFLASLSQDGIDAKQVKALVSKYDKSKNYWAKKTLSHYIQNHLNTHHVGFRDRQKITEILGIKYLPNRG
jgi:hypothetical protein